MQRFEQQVFTGLDGGIYIPTTLFLNRKLGIIKKYVKCKTLTGHISRIRADIEIWRKVPSTGVFVELYNLQKHQKGHFG